MIIKLKYLSRLTFGLTIILLIIACQTQTESIATVPTIEPETSTATPQPLNITTVTLEATPSPTLEITPSATTIPATSTALPPSATATSLPPSTMPTVVDVTLTPLPTLEGEELELAVAELLANPMNCDVPCWWGIIPGNASLNEIKHSFSPYSFDTNEFEEDGEVVHLLFRIGYIKERGDFEERIVFNFSHSILTGITAFSPTISEVLAKYGQPDEVWLETIPREYQNSLPFQLNMVYLELGMAVGYVVDGDHQDDVVIGCFAHQKGNLRIITPKTANSYHDFSPIFGVDRHYRLLEEATNMTMDEFMQAFSDPTNPQCIETPAELWE